MCALNGCGSVHHPKRFHYHNVMIHPYVRTLRPLTSLLFANALCIVLHWLYVRSYYLYVYIHKYVKTRFNNNFATHNITCLWFVVLPHTTLHPLSYSYAINIKQYGERFTLLCQLRVATSYRI